MISSSSRLGRRRKRLWRGAAGDLDEGPAVWDKAKWSAHHPQKTENRSRNLFVLEPLGFARGGRRAFSVFQNKRESIWWACGWARMESAGTSGGAGDGTMREPAGAPQLRRG